MFGCNNDRRFPEKYTVKDSFFGVSTILIVSSSFLVLFRVSIWLLLLLTLIGVLEACPWEFFFCMSLFPDHSPSERAWDEDDCQMVFQFRMIWVNFIIFVHLKSLPAQNSRPSSQVPWVLARAETYLRRNWYVLSSYISQENGDHYYIQTRHNDLFSHYNLILGKFSAELPRKGCINTERVNRIVALAPSASHDNP